MPPSPVIFIDRSPTSETVNAALRSFIATKDLNPPPGLTWRDGDVRDYLHRATVVFHERRHFHDLLATTLGQHLFFSGVYRALTLLTLLYAGVASGQRTIALPLSPSGAERVPYLVWSQLMRGTYKLLEAPAVLCQHALTVRHLGLQAGLAHTVSVIGDDRYSGILYRIAALTDLIGPEAIRDVSLAVVAVMCETPQNVGDTRYDALLAEFGQFETMASAEAKRRLHDMVERRWATASETLRSVNEAAAPWKVQIEQLLRVHTKQMADVVRAAIDDFTAHASELRMQLLDAPESYAHPVEYLGRRWIEPLVFAFSDSCPPMPIDPVPNTQYMRRDVWQTFALGFAPAMALAHASSLNHHFYGPWLKVQAERCGVQFVARG